MPKSMNICPVEMAAKGTISFTDIPVNHYSKSLKEERKNFTDDDFITIWTDMTILREFEYMLSQIKTQGDYCGIEITYSGPAHLSIGQE